VPLYIFRSWIAAQQKFEDLSGDADEKVEVPEGKELDEFAQFPALIWDGPEKSRQARKLSDLTPGATIVLRAQKGGWQALGILPDSPPDPAITPGIELKKAQLRVVDVAELAVANVRRRAVMRIHPALWPEPEAGTAAAELMSMANDPDKDRRPADIQELLSRLTSDEAPGWSLSERQLKIVDHLASLKTSYHLFVDAYPGDVGFVITTRILMPAKDEQDFESMDAEADALLEARDPQELCDHTKDVLEQMAPALSLLPLEPYNDALTMAATLHDWGKADWRFQAMLRSSSVFAAMASGVVLAKSGSITSSLAGRREARRSAELPEGFRHEMLSVQMAESAVGKSMLPKSEMLHALTLHLISTHHGHGRPFAPPLDDYAPPDVSLPMNGKNISVTGAERLAHPAHALDSGIAERFWQLTRRHGWWGLAFLEAVLRLADQSASAHPKATSKS
jgi:CRISPR-associated endonuclease/helicase Cas3